LSKSCTKIRIRWKDTIEVQRSNTQNSGKIN